MMYRKGAIKRKNALHSLCLVALALFSVACQPDNIDQPQRPVGDAVSFRTETLDNFTTRSAGYTTTGAYAVRSMGIYASYTPDVWNGSSAPNNFFDNLSVSRSSDTSPWGYDDEKLWPSSGKLSFFAYAPHRENDAYGTNKPTITPSIGTPTLQYTIASTHDKQVDLLIATPQRDQVKRDYVTMPLRHALTKIAFSARVMNPPAANVQIRVTRIELSGLYGSGSIAMDGQNRQWALSGSNNHTYVQTNSTGGGLNLLPLSAAYQSLTPTNGHLFLLPQALVEGSKGTGATITVTYETQVGTNTPDTKSFDLELTRAISKFNPGDAYNLMLTINNGVTFIVVPTPWDNTEVQADSKNRILNVSRIEAGVYDGALTRIYFWSNQPKDSVYVRAKGNEDNNRYPTGPLYDVNSVFQDLSEPTAVNMHYAGFTGTTASGEGYIDVLHAPGYTNGTASDLSQSRHIWLNASGLARNIRLNSLLKAWEVNIPYVGTFHRWNERGERVIAWTEKDLQVTDTWTAAILDDTGTGADVLIDREQSPFYGHPFTPLYTTNPDHMAAGNPESAPVGSFTPRLTEVGGVGNRIYFRVGWRGATANRTLVRYARIRVTTSKGATYILYLRQGEEPDFVMSYNSTTRTLAMKFSPYNLTEEQVKTGGAQSGSINSDRLNARFTDYPTQAGAFFQWANAVHPRYAYSPISPIGTPSLWNNEDVIGYWSNIKHLYENCPPGYRRPSDGDISGNSNNDLSKSEMRQSLWYNPVSGSDVNNITNSIWGYYADGYFDRRRIVDPVVLETDRNKLTAVASSHQNVAYIGRLFYNPITSASLFFPAAGARPNKEGDLQSLGLFGDYFTTSNPNISSDNRSYLITSSTEAMMGFTKTYYAHSIRCVRDLIFNTNLPPYNGTGVPVALGFDADARKFQPAEVPVDALFVASWNSTMARDFRFYTLEENGQEVIQKITAKVTFRGTTATGNQEVATDIFSLLLGKVGSTVTYSFNHDQLVWTSGTSFTFDVHEGWTAVRYLGTSTSADGTVAGLDGTPIKIVLSGKGRIVFTRKTAPITP